MRTIEEIQADIDAAKAAGEDAKNLEAELAKARKAAGGNGDDPDKTEKTFTQAEVDDIVRKAKAAQKTTFERNLESLKDELAEATAGKEKLEAILKKDMAANLEKLAPATKKLLEKLDIVEQYDWLAEYSPSTAQVETPATPRPGGEGQQAKPHELENKQLV